MHTHCSCGQIVGETIGQGHCSVHHINYRVLNSPLGGCPMCNIERDEEKLKDSTNELIESLRREVDG